MNSLFCTTFRSLLFSALLLCFASGMSGCSRGAEPGEVNVEESDAKDRNDHKKLDDNPNNKADEGDMNTEYDRGVEEEKH